VVQAPINERQQKPAAAYDGAARIEDRTLPASLLPGALLIYYGYPSLIIQAKSLGAAAGQFAKYNDVILGDGLEATSHPDHKGRALPALAAATRVWRDLFPLAQFGQVIGAGFGVSWQSARRGSLGGTTCAPLP
jgi:hypothetical protein